ncbi:benzoate-CoA ligase [Heliophilum fasciatum]|uniref:Benzoate-CoA ligase n=2 Tax=Heliophilum fasciatum TaxID=35700 RepID=A0A4R2RLJ1_9FIRM|nr:benzoate-CoA ligase family protein [Heliophilum fasciatum]MCW2278186.1 benzoate-CoA ligase [Heliophilum fasciatum]TCP63993.1 benzoate-CoA ligase [Heliophilum fasciatum]
MSLGQHQVFVHETPAGHVSWTPVLNAAVYYVDRHIEEGRGEKTAIYYLDQTFTYGQVAEMVNRAGNTLRSLGILREQRVLLLLLDCPAFAAAFFGAMKIGAVPIPVNTLLTPADYLYILQDSRATAAVVSAELLPGLLEVKHQLSYLQHILVVPPLENPQSFTVPTDLGLYDWDEALAGAKPFLEPEATSADEAAFWLYSSGTTGFPKGTIHLHHDMIVCSATYGRHVLNITENDITYSVARLFFAYGLGNALYFPFGAGAATVLNPYRPEPVKVLEIVQKYRPTLYFGVPTSYTAILQVPEAAQRYDLSSIRFCASAGEALPRPIFEQWLATFGLPIYDGIGSTEMAHIFITNKPGAYKAGSSGTLVPGYRARIISEGREVPVGEIGNLMVSGDSAAAGYWNKHEKSKETFQGSWINTGDKYYKDAEGYYWHVGRSDDMLKAGGIWVSPMEVENILMEHPAVLESVVIGHIDEDGLSKPKAFVVLKPGFEPGPAMVKELQNHVKKSAAPYKYPRWIEFVDSLPRTASGKIRRYVLRNLSTAVPAENSQAGA